jgi:hypothetical protein
MRGRTLLLHVGLHKTGSTALQMYLADNRQVLRGLGLFWPVAGTATHAHNHVEIVADLLRGRDFASLPACVALRSELAVAELPSRVVLTSEDFSPNIMRPRFLESLALFCDWLGYRPHIVAYVRPQTDVFNAMFTQKIKNWHNVPPFKEYFLRRLAEPRARFQILFGNLLSDRRFDTTIRPYVNRHAAVDICGDFLAAAGVARDALRDIPRPKLENVTPGPKTVAAFCHLNQWLSDRDQAIDMTALRSLSLPLVRAADQYHWNTAKFDGVDGRLLQCARDSLMDGNEAFAAAVWGKSWLEAFPEESGRQAAPRMFDYETAPEIEKEEFDVFLENAKTLIAELALSSKQAQCT